MTPPPRSDIPDWLDRSRRRASRRWAKMTPEERIADINRGAQEALRKAADWEARRPTPSEARRPRWAVPV